MGRGLRIGLCAVLFAALVGATAAQAGTIRIVAAENFYGDVAARIGGPQVKVTSIISNPQQDPHAFEVSASAARALADAQIVIYNGLGYDSWVTRLLGAMRPKVRLVIDVGALVHRKPGDNPHIWYDPATIEAVAKNVSDFLMESDPAHGPAYMRRLAGFLAALKPLTGRIRQLRRKYAGVTVTATEPVFGYMAAALQLKVLDERFQLAVMNGTEPSAAAIAAFENHLKTRRAKALIYNSQTRDAVSERMKRLAQEAGVPLVPVTETQPQGTTYEAWMMSQLAALDRALSVE